MSHIYQTVKSCIYKTPTSEQVEVVANVNDLKEDDIEDDISVIKETDAPEYTSNKKTDELAEPAPQGSVFWRVSSGLYNTASGAVGLGVGGVKWVAGKSYDVGSTVVSHVKVPSIPRLKRKDKNE